MGHLTLGSTRGPTEQESYPSRPDLYGEGAGIWGFRVGGGHIAWPGLQVDS